MKYASWAASQINRAYQVSTDNFILSHRSVNVFLSCLFFHKLYSQVSVIELLYFWVFIKCVLTV